MKEKRPFPVIVTWEDAHCDDQAEIEPGGRGPRPFVVRSVGYLVQRTSRAVVLSTDLFPDGRGRGINRIPMGMVRSVVPLIEAPAVPAKKGQGA